MEAESSQASTATSKQFQQKLVCINYPGMVKNVDKMLDTLGGMYSIEQAVGTPLKRLELKYHPHNLTSKPAVADKEPKPGVLLKVKIPKTVEANLKKNKTDPESKGDKTKEPATNARGAKGNEGSVGANSDDEVALNGGLEYEVVGITAVTFKFNRLFDYQYVPLVPKNGGEDKDSELEHIHEKIVPKELPDQNWLQSDQSKNCQPFLPSTIFSRSDKPDKMLHFPRSKFYDSRFRSDYNVKRCTKQKTSSNKYIPVPRRNKSYCKSVTITEKQFPMEPYKSSMVALTHNYVTEDQYAKIKKLFEDRPIWSKCAIQHLMGISAMQIKALMSLVGYYFLTGPWRIMWCRYGYDPREHPEARKYQTFDFRIKTSGGLKLGVQAKRNYSKGDVRMKKVSLQQDITKLSKGAVDDSYYILRPNMVPPARQMFYQYCDVHIPEIQAMLTRLPPVAPGVKFDDKNGWLPSSFSDQCREIANRYVTEHVQTLLDEEKEPEMTVEGSDKTDVWAGLELLEISDSDEDDSENEFRDEFHIKGEDDSSEDSEDDQFGDQEGEDDPYDDRGREVDVGQSRERKQMDDEIDLEAVEDVNKILGIKRFTLD